MESQFMKTARELLVKYYSKIKPIEYDETFVVWFCKTLQNWKVLLATTKQDGMYFEVTHNGDTGEIYLDAYVKKENVVFPGSKTAGTYANQQLLIEA